MSSLQQPFQITVVEDSPADLHLIRAALAREEGVELLAIQTGDGALEYVQRIQQSDLHSNDSISNSSASNSSASNSSARPDLLLLDLNLPGAHGHDVLRLLKASPLTSDVPVVIITTSEDPAEMQRSYLLGASAHIVKPEDLDDYFSCIESICRFWRMSLETSRREER